jgi:hypothetical protein
VQLTNCTLAANTAQGGAGGGGGAGGALFNLNGAVMVQNCTLARNTVSGGALGGGEVYNLALGNNLRDGSAVTATLTLANSILADSTGGSDLVNLAVNGAHPNMATATATGPNIVPTSTGTVTGTPPLAADPRPGPLANNGGPTATMELPANSPALNAGATGGAPAADQRGVPRGGGVDLGAYQATASRFMVAGFPSPQTAGATGAFTVTAQDSFGKTAPGYRGTVSFSATGQATLPGPSALNSGSGTFTAILFTAGAQQLTAQDPGNNVSGTQAVSVTPASPAALTGAGGTPQSAVVGKAFAAPLVVSVTDAFGNPVPGISVTFAAPAGGPGGTFAGSPLVTTDAAGRATAPAFTANAAAGSYTVTASAGGLAVSFSLTNAPQPDGVGMFDNTGFNPFGIAWYLRSSTGAGFPDAGAGFVYGGVRWAGVVGDWAGQGFDTVGAVDTTGASNPFAAVWYLRNSNSAGAPDAGTFPYGLPGWIPVAGDWNHTGHTGIGMFDPSTGTWYLRNEASAGAPDAGVFAYGGAGWIPVVGDWANSGRTTVGVVDPATLTWYLRNRNSAGAPDIAPFAYGGVGWRPVAGDWNGDGTTTVGVVDPLSNWYLRNTNSAGAPDISPFPYGLGFWTPAGGDFVPPGQRLLAAAGPGPGADPLADGRLQEVVTAALARLQAAGVDPALVGRLAAAQYVAAPLPAGVLGLAQPWADRVLISTDGAGNGWFTDAATSSDAAFTVGASSSVAPGKMDLLTTVLHEMGHLAGRPDVDAGGHGQDLMADLLPAGVRRTQALDAVFAGALPV